MSPAREPRPTRQPGSPEDIAAFLDDAVQLVEELPNTVAAQRSVYFVLQRLACAIDTAVAAADHLRNASEGHHEV